MLIYKCGVRSFRDARRFNYSGCEHAVELKRQSGYFYRFSPPVQFVDPFGIAHRSVSYVI